MKIMISLTEEEASEMCDNYCKYPYLISDQEIMDSICEKCPMTEKEGKE